MQCKVVMILSGRNKSLADRKKQLEDRTESTEVSLISKEAIPVQNVGFLTSTNLNKYNSLDTFKCGP